MAEKLLYCYNRSCGKQYDESENTNQSCTFHPGIPVFHDAYKGWSCCKKKCTDFTEFLNIKGCTVGKHSNVKPAEPAKPVVNEETVPKRDPIEIMTNRLPRPDFNTPLQTIQPSYAASLTSQLKNLNYVKKESLINDDEIRPGEICKRGGCKKEFRGIDIDIGPCVHHPGEPVFHEGLKFWSCCKKRTTEFSAFLDQVGCVIGEHLWKQTGTKLKKKCRHDWHQTARHVIISIYAKNYDPFLSIIQLNQIRCKIELYFPEDDNKFEMDFELRGVIDVSSSEARMSGTKVEIQLKKAEPGSWVDLTFPQEKPVVIQPPKPKTPVYDDAPVDLTEIN